MQIINNIVTVNIVKGILGSILGAVIGNVRPSFFGRIFLNISSREIFTTDREARLDRKNVARYVKHIRSRSDS